MVCNPLISLGLLVYPKQIKWKAVYLIRFIIKVLFSDVLVIAMVFFFLGWMSTNFGQSERLRSLN